MPHHPDNVLQVNLRIRKELHRKLKRAAADHRISLNSEIAMRLNDSLEDRDAARSLSNIVDHMQIVWPRLAAYFVTLEIEDKLIEALAQNKDPNDIVKLVRDWLYQRLIGRTLGLSDVPGVDTYVRGGRKLTPLEDES
jgi:hypothetical protein